MNFGIRAASYHFDGMEVGRKRIVGSGRLNVGIDKSVIDRNRAFISTSCHDSTSQVPGC